MILRKLTRRASKGAKKLVTRQKTIRFVKRKSQNKTKKVTSTPIQKKSPICKQKRKKVVLQEKKRILTAEGWKRRLIRGKA